MASTSGNGDGRRDNFGEREREKEREREAERKAHADQRRREKDIACKRTEDDDRALYREQDPNTPLKGRKRRSNSMDRRIF